MQKWEYLSTLAWFTDAEWRITKVNGKALSPAPANQQPAIYDYYNQLGDQGWELVSETFECSPRKPRAYLEWVNENRDAVVKMYEKTLALEEAGGELAGIVNGSRDGGWLLIRKYVEYDKVIRARFKRPKA